MRRLRRLMANDTAYGLVLLVFVAAVVMWIYWPHHRARAIVRTQTTVLVEPPLTPPQKRQATHSAAARSPDSSMASRGGPSRSSRGALPGTSGATARPGSPQKRPLPRHKRKAPKTPPRRKPVPQRPNPAPQPPNPPPRPPPPAVGVTVPAPVAICLRPAAGVNCP